MAKILIVVDSTAKAEFMQGYFGDRAECVVCGWPLFTTSHEPHPSAPAGVVFHFASLPNGQECTAALEAHLDQEILLFLDATPRTNYLCWQVAGYLQQIGASPERIKRFAPAAFTAEAIAAALNDPAPVDDRQGLAYYGRLLFDEWLAHHLVRLIGTDRGPGNLPLRHPSLTTLFLLAEREKERLMFQPVNKWQVQAELQADQGPAISAHLAKGLDIPADGLLRDPAKAKIIKDQVTYLPFVVEAIHRSPLKIPPPEPWQLAELAHEAKIRFDLPPATTMTMVRRLYHGVEVEGKVTGLITSYSPLSGGPTDEMISTLRREVARLYGQSAPQDGPFLGSGAIVPLRPELSSAALTGSLSAEEAALYDLIRDRALASQMRPAVGETITVDLRAGKKSVFQALFHELSEPGFLQADPEARARVQGPGDPLPEISEGQEFRPTEVRCQEITGESQLAERYTIDTLFTALADFSIFADPVTMTMVDALLRTEYVAISPQGALALAGNAAKVVTLLDRAFPRMQGVNLSAYIEQTITEAGSGRKNLPFALKQFDQTLMLHGKSLIKAKITAQKIQPRARVSTRIIKQTPATPEPQPPGEAGQELTAPLPNELQPPEQAMAETAPLEELVGQAETETTPEPLVEASPLATMEGEAQGVESAPAQEGTPEAAEMAADLSAPEAEAGASEPWSTDLMRVFAEALSGQAPIDEPLPEPPPPELPTAATTTSPPLDQPRPCPVCGRPMVLKEDTFGAFWGCSGFPACRYSEAVAAIDQGLACPLCGHGLSRKQTPTGKSFYVCGRSECQFISWSIPHYLPCGLCDSPYLVEKTVRGVNRLRCPRAGCPYEQPLPGQNQETTPPPAVTTTKKVLVRRVAAGSTAGSGQTRKVRVVKKR